MILKKLKLENIRSYEKAEVDFSPGSILLAGDIGAGKTTILLAIEFALFGLQPGQRGASLLRNGEKEGKVILEIEVDEKIVIIERGLKSSSKGISQSDSSITIDNNREELSTTELKNRVIKILNYPKEFVKKTNVLYRFTVYTPQEEMKQIILEASEMRLDTLRHIFGIDKYKRIKENSQLMTLKLRELIKNYEGKLFKLEEEKVRKEERKGDIERFNTNLKKEELIFESKKEIRKRIEAEIQELVKYIKEKETYEREADKIRVMLMGKTELINSLKREKITIDREIEELNKTKFSESELYKLEKEKIELEREKQEVSKKYMEISGIISSAKQKGDEIRKLREQISLLRVCPTCLQEVKEDYKVYVLNNFDDNLISLRKKQEENEIEKRNQSKILDELSEKMVQIDRKIRDFNMIKIRLKNIDEKQERIKNIDKEFISINKDMEMLNSQIRTLLETSSEFKKYESLYETKNKELKQYFQEEKNSEILIAEIRKEIQFTLKLIEEITRSIEEKEKLKEKLNYMRESENWLSTDFLELINFAEKNIMLKLIGDFSKLFNEWFNILVPENFSTRLDETFTPIIEQNGFALDYEYMSGGERTAIALAYRLALNQIINSLHSKIKTKEVIILDEPTDGFSEQQLDKMREVFSQLNTKQLIIVSHEQKMEDFVENIINFKKVNGISVIEQKEK
jgi:exonuclease SbcC